MNREKQTGPGIIVSLIGRPNVGKSTIFNRLMGKANRALTHDEPGVTRDRHYGVIKLGEDVHEYPMDAILVDTGGFYPTQVDESENRDKFFNIMAEHARLAVDESDLVLMVCDVREGLLPFDQDILSFIREQKKPVWILVNKYDSDAQAGEEGEFYTLGSDPDDIHVLSGAHGLGFDTLKKKLLDFASDRRNSGFEKFGLQKAVTPRHDVVANLAIIGAPNVGKSTLLNYLTGEKRALVSDIAGTTVDPIEAYIDLNFGKNAAQLSPMPDAFRFSEQKVREYIDRLEERSIEIEQEYHGDLDAAQINFGAEVEKKIKEELFETVEEDEEAEQDDPSSYWRSIKLVDTAGIRRQKKIKGYIEEHSVYRSLRCITNSDIVVLMVDATIGISHQDRRLCDIALEKGKSLLICLNKMDLMREKLKTSKQQEEWIKDLRRDIPWLDFCELIPLSVKDGKGIGRLRKAITSTILVRTRPIKSGVLNRVVFDLIARNPVMIRGSRTRPLKIKYSAMVKASPPTFLLYANRSMGIPRNYRRYLQNNLRREFHLKNTPIHLIFRTNKDLEERLKNR